MRKYSGVAITDVGNCRENNEDNFVLFGDYKTDNTVQHLECEKEEDSNMTVAAVLDGAGGADCGEVASLIGARTIAEIGGLKDNASIRKQLSLVNGKVCAEIEKRQVKMGSTVAALYFYDDYVVSANVGDSRCYLFRDGTIKQLSHDHSEAQQMIDCGEISESDARTSKKWHVITQYLGKKTGESSWEPCLTGPLQVEPGDQFLICSDGLTDSLYDEDIESFLREQSNNEVTLTDVARKLIDLALESEGKDNVTVVLIECKQDETIVAHSAVDSTTYRS